MLKQIITTTLVALLLIGQSSSLFSQTQTTGNPDLGTGDTVPVGGNSHISKADLSSCISDFESNMGIGLGASVIVCLGGCLPTLLATPAAYATCATVVCGLGAVGTSVVALNSLADCLKNHMQPNNNGA
jgi:hypothetical protein